MSISIITALKTYNPVRNPIEFRVEGSEFDPGTPVRPNCGIQFDPSDMPQDGDTLTITADILGDPIVFTFRTTPDPELDELPIYPGSDLAGYLITIAGALVSNYAINSNYYSVVFPTGGGNGIVILAARSLSDNFDTLIFNATQDVAFTVDGYVPLILTNEATVPYELPANSALLLQLEVYSAYPTFTPTIILEEAYTPDSGGGVEAFDPSDALRSILTPYLPASNIVTNRSMHSAMTTFRVFAAERYGDPSTTNKLVATPWVFAYLAGRNEQARIAQSDWGTDMHGSAYKFLSAWNHTTYNTRKLVVPKQVEYLSWIYPATGPSTIKVKVDIYYESGAPELAHLLDTINGKYNDLLITPCGAGPLGLASLDTSRRIDHYRVYLTNGSDEVISQYRWYQMDYLHHEYLVQLIWWSSTGNVDTVTLTGQRDRESDVETVVSGAYNRFPASMAVAGNISTRTNRIDHQVQQGTSYLREHEMAVLSDLMASEAVHRLRNDGQWVRTEMIGKRAIDLAQDGAGIMSVELTYRDALTNTAL